MLAAAELLFLAITIQRLPETAIAMPALENQQPNRPPGSAAPFVDSDEMRQYQAAQDAAPTYPRETYLTPYLGLYARLSQVWINRWTVLLLLVLVRTLFAIASINDNLGSARREALHACTSVEQVGSSMASMPHYMATGVNELSASGIEKAIDGLQEMLLMSITAVENIIVFVINLITQTYLCLITLAVSGSLHVAISVAEDVGDFLNSTAKAIGDDLGDAAEGLQKTLNGFLSGLNDFGSLFTGDSPDPPSVDFAKQIKVLNNLQLPSDYDKGLEKLKDNIPTFKDVNEVTQAALRLPFQEVKKLVSSNLPKYKLDRSLFPVPAKEQLSFCSDDNGINDFFDGLIDIGRWARGVFIGVLITLAILACFAMAWREHRRWKMMQDRAQIVKSSALDSMDAVYIVSRPITSTVGLKLAERFQTLRIQVLVRWSVAYATTVPVLFVLSLAVTGLFACLCQYILLQAIVKEVPKLSSQVVDFTDKVVLQLNNASEQWAVGTNAVILDTNANINQDVFGWVNTTTGAVNDTLNTFVDGMTDKLEDVFGDTILYDAIMEVLNCLILLKIEGIQKGLTWVSNHAHIDFPLLPQDTFSRGAMKQLSGSETSVLATGPDNDMADAITGVMAHVVNHVRSRIRLEAIISTFVLVAWLLVVLIGVFRAVFFMVMVGDEKVLIDRKGAGWSHDGASSEHELKDWSHAQPPPTHIPTYEQATRTNTTGDNSAGKYLGQSYTLQPHALPTLSTTNQNNVVSSPLLHSGFSPRPAADNEKLGNVLGQHVDTAVRRPTHARASSHGDYHIHSPLSAAPANQLRDSPHLQLPRAGTRQNPFADPRP